MKKAAILSILVATGLLADGVKAEAQQTKKVPRIGVVVSGRAESPALAFRQGLRDLGYVEGKNLVFEYRSVENKLERLSAVADELLRLKVDVLVTSATPAAIAAKNATRTIPIVF